jgi:hypothetical protein
VVQFQAREREFSDRLWIVSFLSEGYGGCFSGRQNDRGVNLTAHLHLVSRFCKACSCISTPILRLHFAALLLPSVSVKLSLCLIKRQGMKMYGGVEA